MSCMTERCRLEERNAADMVVIDKLVDNGDCHSPRTPSGGRALTLSNGDSKAVAAMVALPFTATADRMIYGKSRGYTKGRTFTDNLLEMEAWASSYVAAPPSGSPAMLLWDIARACPSVRCQCLWQVLLKLQLHPAARLSIANLYKRCRHMLRVRGGRSHHFDMLRGLKQGCPLSTVILIFVIDPFIRMTAWDLGPDGATLQHG